MSFFHEIGDAEVEVEASVSKYIPAYTSGLPENCYEEEGGEVELHSVMYKGRDILKKLRDKFYDEICEAAYENSQY